MAGVFLPAGYQMTFTASAVKAGDYTLVGSDDSYTSVAANATATIGPFNDARQYNINDLSYSQVASGVFTGADDNSKAPLASPTFTGMVTLAHGTGTEAANVVTINAQSGVITTSALTTAASGSYLITLTNSAISGTGNVIIASIAGGTNTTKDISVEATCTAANTATLTIYNNVLITTALNGTVKINFLVV